MINLDYQSRKPIYEQIVQEIERYVALSILKPEEQIPSIRDMATELGVNPNTVKKAYSILESRGVISTYSTKGTFISKKIDSILEKTINEKIEQIKKYIEEIENYGLTKKEILQKIPHSTRQQKGLSVIKKIEENSY